MDPDFLHAINGDWDSLLAAMRESHTLVRRTDSNGMTVLHWICLHQDIPTDVLIKVVFANPYAVQMKNNAGHLPIDLAIQAECEERILEVLRAANTGDTQESARHSLEEPEEPESKHTQDSMNSNGLYSIYTGGNHHHSQDMPSPTQTSARLKSLALTEQRLRERENDLISCATDDHQGPLVFDNVSQRDLAMIREFAADPQDGSVQKKTQRPRSQSSFPPRWKQSRNCHVCHSGFSLVKRRHHCRNCGQSVCGLHSTNRVALPKFGLADPQRICDRCFLGGRHMANGSAVSEPYRIVAR